MVFQDLLVAVHVHESFGDGKVLCDLQRMDALLLQVQVVHGAHDVQARDVHDHAGQKVQNGDPLVEMKEEC